MPPFAFTGKLRTSDKDFSDKLSPLLQIGPPLSWQTIGNLRISDIAMSSPSTILHGSPQKRPPSLRLGALKIAFTYLVFATLWIAFSDEIISRIADKRRV